MAHREAELREALGMEPADPDAPLTPAEAADLTDHPASPGARPRRNSVTNRSRST
jgi:hypothetical protein